MLITNTIKNLDSYQFSDFELKLDSIKERSTILVDTFHLPGIFYFTEDEYNLLPEIFKVHFLKSILFSIASFSKNGDDFCINIKGYKTKEFHFKNKDLSTFPTKYFKDIFKIYDWIFNEIKLSDVRLPIVRSLLTLDIITFKDLLNNFEHIKEIHRSARHHSELAIHGNIKDHFEFFEKTNEYIRSVQENFSKQISELNNITKNLVFPIFGLLFSFFLKTHELTSSIYYIFSVFFLLYLIFLREIKLQDIKELNNLYQKQFEDHIKTLKNKLKIIDDAIQIKVPVYQILKLFNKNYRLVGLVLNLLIILFSFALGYLYSPDIFTSLVRLLLSPVS